MVNIREADEWQKNDSIIGGSLNFNNILHVLIIWANLVDLG